MFDDPAGQPASFLFFCCQVGAEPALKAELAATQPNWRLAYSRPGFLTFKAPQLPFPQGEGLVENEVTPPTGFVSPTFARAWGVSLGKVAGDDDAALAAQTRRIADLEHFDRVHVWERDLAPVGDHGFEPLPTPRAAAACGALLGDGASDARSGVASPGQRVFDCVIVGPDEWWIGWHMAGADPASCWVGGAPAISLPPDAISRAYLKMEESLLWSRFTAAPGDRWAEIGCAPGGASQALLARGMRVLGIDPAEVDSRLVSHSRFEHLKMRGADVRRREFRDIRWLTADVNVAPRYTLDAVEAIVTHAAVDVEGLLLTLKLPDWRLAAELPQYLERVRSWGYPVARARQLAFNRQELCLAALRPPRVRRPASSAKRHVPRRLRTRRKRLD